MTLSRATYLGLIGILLVALPLAHAALGQVYAPQQNPANRNPQAPAQRRAGPQQANQQQANQQQAGPQQFRPQQNGPAQRPVAVQQQMLPCPFPQLSPREVAYRDDVLKYWEQRSSKVNRFETEFIRWDYDTKFGPEDPNKAKTISYGEIKYEKPDKGMFRVDRITHFTPPPNNPNNPEAAQQDVQYLEQAGEMGEHWVSDGKSIFMFDAPQKQLTETKLPAELQGQGIVNGPLPFLFGAKSEKIKQRYWTRMILPAPVKEQYWMEAYPKFMEDRAQYSKVLVILDKEKYLPIAVQIFDRNYDRLRNPSRISFEFQNRVENPNLTLQKLNLFHRSFFEPKLPSGWKRVVQQLPAGGARMAQGQQQGVAPGQR